ncbi:cyclic nucleotide-binding domain-containing protein [Paenibacillus athensensis]|uniref:ADP,ATP carrier protein n=1 Tax=Paenibacillus athensensis TaxID=1967502 RepID=A0A4Y8PZH1_9BACL|nr:Npt1/Npt2 family nucleotide transporter [Paenibacillus athensensis]MCD1258582.1 cyclic nucleotide-binding domain-containing protein [Paenibacillus athensensis]
MNTGKSIQRFAAAFDADRAEYSKAVLLFGYLFCVASASTIGRTAADTLFLSKFSGSALSWMYLPQAVTMIVSGLLFQRFAPRIRLERLIQTLIPAIALLACLSRIGVGLDLIWVFPVIYIGFDVFNFLMIVCFWQFAPAVMDERKAKRMIGLVGSGGIAGSIISGFGLKAFVPLLGTANLIYVYAGLQLAALAVVTLIRRRYPPAPEAGAGLTTRDKASAAVSGTVRPGRERQGGLFKHVPYLKYVAVLAAALVFSLTLIDYQFKSILRESLQNEALAGFMGTFYGFSGIVALLVQLFASGWLISRLGMMTTLLIFPVALFAGSLGIVALPVLATAVLVKGSDKVVGDTIYSSVSQLLMFPIPPEWRTRAKSFLDGVVRNGAKGVAALCLLAVSHVLAPAQLSYIVLALLAAGVFAALKVKKAYLRTLLATLQTGKHDWQKAQLDFMDPASLRLLTDALSSPNKRQALYALRLLRQLGSFDIAPHLPALLAHPAPEVSMEALLHLEQLAASEMAPTLRRLLHSPAATPVRAQALIALAACAREDDLAFIAAYLDEPEPELQTAAIAGLVKYYGIDGMFRAVARLKELIDSDLDAHRIAVAGLFGQIGVRSFYQPLAGLLRDRSPQVRVRALESAAALRVPALIPAVLDGLRDAATRRQAVDALAAHEEALVLPLLAEAMQDDGLAPHLPAVFERIGTQAAFDALLAGYAPATLDQRDRIIDALCRMRKNALAVQPLTVERLIADEIRLYHELAAQAAPLAGLPSCVELTTIVGQLRFAASRRVFRGLALIYDAPTMQAVFVNWSEGDARRQANAAEVIDQTVQGPLRAQLAGLMAAPRRLPAGPSGGAAGDAAQRAAALAGLAGQADGWLREVAAYVAGSGGHGDGDAAAAAASATTASAAMAGAKVAGAARVGAEAAGAERAASATTAGTEANNAVKASTGAADARTPEATGNKAAQHPTPAPFSATAERIERVSLLQNVPAFQGLTSKELAGIATRLHPLRIPAGQTIVSEGDPGDCLYIISSGQAGVWRSERLLGELQRGDCFGEMALFGQGLRTATVRAETESELWRLDSAIFYDILYSHTSIAFEIMRLLSRRLRMQLENGGARQAGGAAAATAPAGAAALPQAGKEARAANDFPAAYQANQANRTNPADGATPAAEAAPATEANANTATANTARRLSETASSEHELILRRILTLQRIELFVHLTEEDFIWLAHAMEEVEYPAGAAVCRMGDYGDTMYAIISGEIRVHAGSTEFARLREGEYFGEMAVIDSGPRSADCSATTDVVLLEVHRDMLLTACFQNANVLKSMLRVLAERLQRL